MMDAYSRASKVFSELSEPNKAMWGLGKYFLTQSQAFVDHTRKTNNLRKYTNRDFTATRLVRTHINNSSMSSDRGQNA